jgi:3',5'-cyclic AMP phosphodiesterase CpdA
MRLAHCSDLHLLSHDGAGWLKLLNKRWIGAANLITNRSRHYHVAVFEQMVEDLNAQGIEHVLCTGDVTNLALEQEFVFARARFDKLSNGPTHVTVIPGNHDAYVPEGIEHFARVFDEYHRADDGWQWTDADRVDDRDDDLRWPIVRIRGELALIGVTTSRATAWFTAYGMVREGQLARLRRVLVDERLRGKARVVAIHHPPAGPRAESRIRGLHDHAAFAAVIAETGADLIVHGHEHRDMTETLAGPTGPVQVRGVASGTYENKHPEFAARYRIYEIDRGSVRADHLRVWSPERRCFEARSGTEQQSNYGT